jgi:hypothetical protein
VTWILAGFSLALVGIVLHLVQSSRQTNENFRRVSDRLDYLEMGRPIIIEDSAVTASRMFQDR